MSLWMDLGMEPTGCSVRVRFGAPGYIDVVLLLLESGANLETGTGKVMDLLPWVLHKGRDAALGVLS